MTPGLEPVRAEFETWSKTVFAVRFDRDKNGDYRDLFTNYLWIAFARGHLVATSQSQIVIK